MLEIKGSLKPESGSIKITSGHLVKKNVLVVPLTAHAPFYNGRKHLTL